MGVTAARRTAFATGPASVPASGGRRVRAVGGLGLRARKRASGCDSHLDQHGMRIRRGSKRLGKCDEYGTHFASRQGGFKVNAIGIKIGKPGGNGGGQRAKMADVVQVGVSVVLVHVLKDALPMAGLEKVAGRFGRGGRHR